MSRTDLTFVFRKSSRLARFLHHSSSSFLLIVYDFSTASKVLKLGQLTKANSSTLKKGLEMPSLLASVLNLTPPQNGIQLTRL